MLAAFGLFASAALATVVYAQVVTDDFSNSTTTNTNWSAAGTGLFGPDTAPISPSLAQGSGVLAWSGTSGTNGFATRTRTLQTYVGTYSSNWSVSLDAFTDFVGSSGSQVQLGLVISNQSGAAFGGPPPTHDYVKLVLKNDGTLKVHGGVHTNGSPIGTPASWDLTGVSSGKTLQVSYDAATHKFTTSYDSVAHATFRIDNSNVGSPTQYTNWGMSGSDAFLISIFAMTMGPTSGSLSDFGSATYLDSFSASGLTAVPEPSTYALAAGLAAAPGGVSGMVAARRPELPAVATGLRKGGLQPSRSPPRARVTPARCRRYQIATPPW